ncbi:NUDIX hydrolase [Alphaproteobacteria bacterium]
MNTLDLQTLRKSAIEKLLSRNRNVLAAYLVLIDSNQQILLYKRHNTGFCDNRYSLVAGHVEKHESILEALIRETSEESGIRLREEDLTQMTAVHRFSYLGDILDFFVLCKKWEGQIQNLEPEKCAELRFFPLSALPADLIPYVRVGVESVVKNIPYVVYGWDDVDRAL